MAGNLQAAFDWEVRMCNMANPYCLYSQADREGYVDASGNIYYDCSSFQAAALTAAGFYDANPWFYTGNMRTYLKQAGFDEIIFSDGAVPSGFEFKNGDILMRGDGEYYPVELGHTEMIWDAAHGYSMGAHTSDADEADQVSLGDFDQHNGIWYFVYRYPGGLSGFTAETHPWANASGMSWVYDHNGGGFEIGTTAAVTNAKIVFWYTYNAGWTRAATMALLGNMQAESGINPDRYEVGGEGYGLVQWTPKTVLTVAQAAIYGSVVDYDGDRQMNVLLGEYMQTNFEQWHGPLAKDLGIGRQWYNSSGSAYGFDLPAVDWYEWATSPSYSLSDLTKMFMVSYLRPAYDASVNHWAQRLQFAGQWDELLKDYTPPGATPEPAPRKRRRMPLWMMLWP